MENDPNPMCEIVPCPRLKAVGNYVLRKLCMLPDEAPDYMSGHYRGGGPALDQGLYDGNE